MTTQTKSTPKSKALPIRPVAELMALPPQSIVTLAECATLGRVSLRHVAAMRSEGKGPKTVNVGRSVRLTLADALAWINPTSTPAGSK